MAEKEYIERNAVLQDWPLCDEPADAYQFIRSFPAADVVERKTGKWIIKDNPGTGWYQVICSACGENVTSTAPVIGFFPDAEVIWNYCPECGSYNGGDDDV